MSCRAASSGADAVALCRAPLPPPCLPACGPAPPRPPAAAAAVPLGGWQGEGGAPEPPSPVRCWEAAASVQPGAAPDSLAGGCDDCRKLASRSAMGFSSDLQSARKLGTSIKDIVNLPVVNDAAEYVHVNVVHLNVIIPCNTDQSFLNRSMSGSNHIPQQGKQRYTCHHSVQTYTRRPSEQRGAPSPPQSPARESTNMSAATRCQ